MMAMMLMKKCISFLFIKKILIATITHLALLKRNYCKNRGSLDEEFS